MKVGHLYELSFPYEERQGSSKRPVLIIIINNENNKALGLKVTRSDNKRYKHRMLIANSPHTNLNENSYVQYDRYDFLKTGI